MATVKCYCGKVFATTGEYRSRGFITAQACPGCGHNDHAATYGGRVAQEIIYAGIEEDRVKAVMDKVRRGAEQGRLIAEHEAWLAKHYKRMGFTKDWVPSYNVRQNGPNILEWLPDIGADDFCWLCNKLGRAIQSTRDTCIDRIRLSYAVESSEYIMTRDKGCCGFYDVQVRNAKTGNYFWIGFNYGH